MPAAAAPVGNLSGARPAGERPDPLTAPAPSPGPAAPSCQAGEAPLVVDTDPAVAGTAALRERHGAAPDESADCVVVAGRGGGTAPVASVVRAHTRAVANGVVRRVFGAGRAPRAPRDTAVTAPGGLTPSGLSGDRPLLADPAVLGVPRVVVGSGLRRSGLLVPGKARAGLPGARVVAGLAVLPESRG